MKLASLLSVSGIMMGLKGRTIRDLIPEMLEREAHQHPSDSMAEVGEAILHRESQASTAMAKGLAIPHARISELNDFYVLLGIPQSPLEDNGLDGQPVQWVFLLAASDQKNTMLLQSMAAISTLFKDEERLAEFQEVNSPEAVWNLIEASGVQVKKGLHARDMMRAVPFIAREDMPLRELLDAFFEHRVYSAPVCNTTDEILGSITTKEIIDAGFPDYMSRIPKLDFLSEYEPFEQFFRREATTLVGSILNRNPLVVAIDDPMIQVVFHLKQCDQHFAYVEEGGRLVGIIDRNDIISRILRV